MYRLFHRVLLTCCFTMPHVQDATLQQDAVLPLSAAAMALPPLAIRGDLGVLSTAAVRYTPSLLKSFLQMGPQV